MDTLTLILPNAMDTLNRHLYICVSPGLIHLDKGFRRAKKQRRLYPVRVIIACIFFL